MKRELTPYFKNNYIKVQKELVDCIHSTIKKIEEYIAHRRNFSEYDFYNEYEQIKNLSILRFRIERSIPTPGDILAELVVTQCVKDEVVLDRFKSFLSSPYDYVYGFNTIENFAYDNDMIEDFSKLMSYNYLERHLTGLCPQCFEDGVLFETKLTLACNRCGSYRRPIEIDKEMIGIVSLLNCYGYYTQFSCSGHGVGKNNGYLMFYLNEKTLELKERLSFSILHYNVFTFDEVDEKNNRFALRWRCDNESHRHDVLKKLEDLIYVCINKTEYSPTLTPQIPIKIELSPGVVAIIKPADTFKERRINEK